MTPIVPTLTLDELKQNAKNLRAALLELSIDFSHQSSLNVASKGFGYPDYNTAKALLEETQKKHSNTINRDDINETTTESSILTYRRSTMPEYAYSLKEFIRHYLILGFSQADAHEIGEWHYDLYGGGAVWPTMDGDFCETSPRTALARKIDIVNYLVLWSVDKISDKLGDEWIAFTETQQWYDIYGPELVSSPTFMTEHVASILDMNYDEAVACIEKERNHYKQLVMARRG